MISNELIEGVLTVAKLKAEEANADPKRDVILYPKPRRSDIRFALEALIEIGEELKNWGEK